MFPLSFRWVWVWGGCECGYGCLMKSTATPTATLTSIHVGHRAHTPCSYNRLNKVFLSLILIAQKNLGGCGCVIYSEQWHPYPHLFPHPHLTLEIVIKVFSCSERNGATRAQFIHMKNIFYH